MAFNPDAYLKSLEQAPVDTFDPDAYLKSLEPPKAEESSFARRAFGDTAVGLSQGVVSAGQAAVGIADIPTFGAAGKALSAIGYDPQRTNQILQELKSPEEQAIEKKIAETKGFLATAKETITHPTALLDFTLQSAPSMIGAAGIGRKILTTADKMLAKKLGLTIEEYAAKKAAETAASTVAAEAATQRAILAGSAGEGAISAGSTAEQIREQNPSGYLTPAQDAISVVSGALTSVLGVFGGKLANKLKIGDIDTLLVGGAGTAARTAVKKNIFLKAAEGVLSESVFEELPQSMQEQISQNLATGKPWDQGVAEAGAQGAMAALGMGGIGGGVSQYSANKQIEKNAQAQPAIETPAVPLIEAQAGTVPPVVKPAGVPPVVNPVLTDADVEDLQEEPITSSTFVPKTGNKVNVTWKNADETEPQTATGEVVTWKDGSQYVKVETGQLENGKITYTHVPIANANVQVTPIETAPVETAAPAVTPTEVVAPTPVEAPVITPVEKPKTQAQKNQERQQEKKINAIDAKAIRLDAYYNGINTAMMNRNKSELFDTYGDDGLKAIEILKNNNLVAEDKDGKLSLLPAGQSLLTDIRNYNPKNSQEAVSTQDALFAKHIKQLQAPTTPVAPKAELNTAKEWNDSIKVLQDISDFPNVKYEDLEPSLQKRIAEVHSVDGKLGPKNMAQFTPEIEKHLTVKANKDRIAEQKRKAKNKSNTLLTKLIDLGGVSIKDKRDVTGEKQSFPPGYARAFRTDAKTSLRGHIERGDLDEFLPNNMRLSANTMAQGAFDSEPAYDYLSNLIKNGKSVTPYIEAEKQATEFERYAGTETMLSDSEGDVLDDLVKWATEGGIDLEAIRQSLVGENNAQKERNLLRMLQEARDEEQSNAEPIETTKGPAGPDIKTGIQETAGELKLTGQTEAEIKADEAKAKANAEAKAKEEAQAEQKRKAEKETFTLTGSDREADIAGAKDLFAQPEPKKETKLQGTVTEDGFKIKYPIAVGLVDAGYEMLALDNPKSYKDNGGETHRSFIKDGVRISVTPQQSIAVQSDKLWKGVQIYNANDDEMVLENIYVEPSKRNTGAASLAMKQLVDLADKSDVTLYVEPVQLDKTGITKERLSAFYSKFGFKVQNVEDGRVLVRKPNEAEASKAKTEAEIEADEEAAYEALQEKAETEEVKEKPFTEVTKPSKIEDFGEKIFVKKDAFANFKNKVDESKEVDIETSPLSKSWVEPDYQKLLDEGMSPFGVAFLHSTRDAVPTKPKATWKLRSWVKKVNTLRDLSYGFIDGNITEEQIKEIINKEDEYSNYNYLKNRIDLYLAAGHEKSLKGYELSKHSWTYYKGMKYDPPGVILWDVISANGTRISESEDREEAIAKFVTAINKPKAEIEKAEIKFGVWSRRDKDGFFIGKKIGKNIIYLKMLPTVKEARDYILNNHDELVAQFEKYKEIPSERGEINQVRVGADHRMGANVSQEQFFDTFGFRSTIFGNTVNNARRQQDLNNAYDALMDLAGVLEIPPKALSMNGEIGLLFGADGRGGKNPASAHYSNSKLAINLTKTNGAGSLAHELFHALDNYFSRMGGDKYKMLTETQKASANVRPEVVAAFKDLMTAISATSIKERSKNLDKRRTKEYWSTGLEMAARAFESYVINKLKDQNASNDYLANIVSEKEFNNDYLANIVSEKEFNIEDGYPYPTAAEIPAIRAAFDNFFNVLETKETDKGVMLYNIDTKVQTKTPDEVRDERIQELRVASMKVGKAVKHIADYGSNLPLQRKLNKLLEREASLKDYLESTKPENNSDADFMARATKELAAGNISEEVEAVIRQIYEKYPGVLSGLKLSVKQNKHSTSSAAGAFNPYARIVSLYKNTSGVEDESTVRHEIVHSLEQMMTPQAAQAVVNAWARAFEKAMKKNIDPASKAYFDAVLEFLASPSKESFEKATNLMPSYNFYQYLNPSEYWAVNAESMLQAKLGTPWHRFVLGVKRLIEGFKSVLGFDNTYVVHNALNNLLKTTPQRLSKTSLVDYVVRGKVKIDFLNNIDDERRLMDNLGVPNVPSHIPKTLREKIGETHKSTEELVGEIKRGPNNVLKAAGLAVGDAITEARIQAINFNAGLERADANKYAGKIRDANNNMLPSIAVKNATHANSVYNAVLHQGKMRYDETLGAFTAYDSDESLKNIVELQHKLRKKTGVELGDKVINSWFAAKRTKGIQDNYLNLMMEINSLQEELLLEDDPEVIAQLTADLNAAQHWLDALEAAFINVPSFLVRVNPAKPTKVVDGKTIPNIIYDRDGMPVLNDDAIDEIIALEDKYPELKEMMKNWKGVSHNMIDNMAFSSRISQKEADGLKEIKDYSPWQRIRDEEEEGLFGNRSTGATSGIARFRKTRTELPLENVVENMTNQVKRMVNSSLTSFAYNRIAMEYAVRKDQVIDKKTGLPKVDKTTGLPAKGKIKVFPKEREGRSSEGVVFPIYVNGNRIHIQIEDSQIADALLGLAMGPVNVPFQAALSGFSNLVRRSITFSGYFQTKQVFYDAPTAAWVSGVKSPFKVWVKSFSTYAKALGSIVTGVDAPTIKILKAAGVGGYHTFHRESLAEEQTTLEAISGKGFARFKRMVDRIGDASDYAQRGAIYDQVLAETGDPSLALLKASDIVDWNKRGLHDAAQGLRQTVPFLGAYAIQLDALSQAAIAGGTISSAKAGKEVTRRQALMQFYLKTGLGMALLVAAYTLAAGSDDDYWKLDDDTRARNFYVPGSKKAFGNPILIPMHSTAALFWKVIPESMLSYVLSQGTKNEIDATRARTALWKATRDSVLGPMPIPAAIKTPVEIAIDHDFFTGTNVVPQSLAKLDASEQYNYNTSELGKALSVATTIPFTGNKDKQGNRQGEKRVLSPIEADHLIRGWLGSVGSISEWVSNQLFGEHRPTSELRSNPLVGGIVGPETSRRNEALFYDLKDRTEPAYNTYIKLIKENKASEVKNFYDANRNLIEAYGYTSKMDSKLQELNSYMKFVGKIEDKSWTKDKKLAEILRMQKIKSDILEGTLYFRKRAGL